jgi:alkaline phosphatase D
MTHLDRRSVLASLAALPLAAGAMGSRPEKPLSRIAFGSCARQDRPQPIWESIVAAQPDLFLMLGDNIYGDSENMDVLRAKYQQLSEKPGFQKLRETCPLLATWDDHDFGVNDGGADYPQRAASQKVFMEFFKIRDDSPLRTRPGIYDAQVFGPEGKRVQVILLDTRYFRGKLRHWSQDERPAGCGPYQPHELDSGATLLGEAQWTWLAGELQKPAEVRIIASSIQLVPTENCWEIWNNFPAERRRLFDLLAQAKASGVLFVSGDRHLGEISRIEGKESGTGYPLYEVTSSSLNQPGGAANADEVNRFRVGGKNYGDTNFGSITIDWSQTDPAIGLALHGEDGKVVREVPVRLSHLKRA